MTVTTPRAHIPMINRDYATAKAAYFVDVQLWPLQQQLDTEGWLQNFTEDELPFALRLLESFLYFSESLTDQLLRGAFQSLSRTITANARAQFEARAAWRTFVDRAIFTFPSGEQPNVTDSGYLFARKARQVLNIEQERILEPGAALKALMSEPTLPIVFVDDFVGTGWQFEETWSRSHDFGPTSPAMSFARYARLRPAQIYYIPLVCTQQGADFLDSHCDGVTLAPAHILSPQYSAVVNDSHIWPQADIAEGIAFLRAVALRTGMVDTNGADEADWQGLQRLGLTIAFSHSVPDATLPIFHWEQGGWKPLVRRA